MIYRDNTDPVPVLAHAVGRVEAEEKVVGQVMNYSLKEGVVVVRPRLVSHPAPAGMGYLTEDHSSVD
jgi:hypothetical protein